MQRRPAATARSIAVSRTAPSLYWAALSGMVLGMALLLHLV